MPNKEASPIDELTRLHQLTGYTLNKRTPHSQQMYLTSLPFMTEEAKFSIPSKSVYPAFNTLKNHPSNVPQHPVRNPINSIGTRIARSTSPGTNGFRQKKRWKARTTRVPSWSRIIDRGSVLSRVTDGSADAVVAHIPSPADLACPRWQRSLSCRVAEARKTGAPADGGKVERNEFPVSTLPPRAEYFRGVLAAGDERSLRGSLTNRLRSKRFQPVGAEQRALYRARGNSFVGFYSGYQGQRSPWQLRLARPSPIIDFCNFPCRFA